MKNLKQVAVIVAAFVAVQLLAIAFMHYALGEEDQVFSDPGDPMIAVYYILMLLGFTVLFLILVKFNLDKVMKGIFFVSIGFIVFFVATFLSAPLIPDSGGDNSLIVLVVGIAFAVLSILAIWRYPEWWVIDIVGLPMAVGIIALLGISFSIVPMLVLLIGLAVYDFISVYKTKHMLTLAEGVSEMGLPLLIVIPKKLPYSYREQKIKLTDKSGEKKEREAFLVGLGDLIIPGLLASSAFWFISISDAFAQSPISLFDVPGYILVALGTIAGAAIGLVALMRIVVKGNPQAGLPLLNGGAIAGFFISYILVFGLNFSYIG